MAGPADHGGKLIGPGREQEQMPTQKLPDGVKEDPLKKDDDGIDETDLWLVNMMNWRRKYIADKPFSSLVVARKGLTSLQ